MTADGTAEQQRSEKRAERRVLTGRTLLGAAALVWLYLGHLLLVPYTVSSDSPYRSQPLECRSALAAAVGEGQHHSRCEGLREGPVLVAVLAAAVLLTAIGLYVLLSATLTVRAQAHARDLARQCRRLDTLREQLEAYRAAPDGRGGDTGREARPTPPSGRPT